MIMGNAIINDGDKKGVTVYGGADVSIDTKDNASKYGRALVISNQGTGQRLGKNTHEESARLGS